MPADQYQVLGGRSKLSQQEQHGSSDRGSRGRSNGNNGGGGGGGVDSPDYSQLRLLKKKIGTTRGSSRESGLGGGAPSSSLSRGGDRRDDTDQYEYLNRQHEAYMRVDERGGGGSGVSNNAS